MKVLRVSDILESQSQIKSSNHIDNIDKLLLKVKNNDNLVNDKEIQKLLSDFYENLLKKTK